MSFTHGTGVLVRAKRHLLYLLRAEKLTLRQRLVRASLIWGIPMVFLELIGIPVRYWAGVLILVLPATGFGVITYALLEHGLILRRSKDEP